MAKYKVKVKDKMLIVRARLSFGEKLDERSLDFFMRKYIRGLLKAKLIKKNNIEYMGPVGISLAERLKRPISRHDFFFVMEQVADVTQKVHANELNVNDIVFDMKNIFINEVTKEMQFIYLPLEGIKGDADILGFLEKIIYSVIPTEEEGSDYVSDFVYFLKGLPKYRADLVEQYILKEDRNVVNTIKRHGTGQSGFMVDKQRDYYAHYEAEERDTEVLEEDTGLLGEEEEGTALLEEEEETGVLRNDICIHNAALTRVLTEETIEINKIVFRIGKGVSHSDYCVANNDKVSRSHANIVVRGDRYFVVDIGSRNGTFINGQAVAPQQETELFDGDCLKLANEEFVFHM